MHDIKTAVSEDNSTHNFIIISANTNSSKNTSLQDSLYNANDKLNELLSCLESCVVDNISDELILHIGNNTFFKILNVVPLTLHQECLVEYLNK